MLARESIDEFRGIFSCGIAELSCWEGWNVGAAGGCAESASTQSTRGSSTTTTLLASAERALLRAYRFELGYLRPFFEDQADGKRVSKSRHSTLVIPAVVADQVSSFFVWYVQCVSLEQTVSA